MGDASRSGPTCWPQRAERSCVRLEKSCVASKRDALSKLLSLEMGKIYVEGFGEVQEAVDICDYAVVSVVRSVDQCSRHFMMERYNPLKGHVGLGTAFNFPCAVLFWTAALSMVWRFKSPLSHIRFHRWRAPRLLPTCWSVTVNILV
ncbi:hypothetical protein PsorP6_001475 [Peronosclerospora sorghi]|uniref:Uncharacterized protein n=1 Tax=Peronosclerospora sorghi TaxID=230839 RepID=A0ACC0WT01_9STRA|nr:hypothetical protein PsorP6_001475 [Peronosclerospora sorghi]